MKASGEKRTKRGPAAGAIAVGGMAAALMVVGPAPAPANAAGPAGREPVPMMYIGDVRVNEGEFDSAVAKIPITLSAPLAADTYFTVQTVDDAKGGAQAGQDYKPKNVRKKMRAGATSAVIAVPILGDAKPEGLEQVRVRFTALGAPVAIVKDLGSVTIVDDDDGSGAEVPAVLSASATSVVEGDAVKRSVPVTLRLSRAQASDVTVTWKAVGDTATPDSDFKAMSKTTVIKAGRVHKTVKVPMYGDSSVEADEQMRVVVTSVAGASGLSISVDPLNGIVVMMDDDADSDDDGLPDVAERYTKTDPHGRDTDGDQLADGDEVRLLFTSPLQADTDADGFDDLVELKAGTDPLDAADRPFVD